MSYTILQIAEITGAQWYRQIRSEAVIEHLVYDSRKVYFPETSLFFAIKSSRRNGHHFIPELYEKGVRNFVISEKTDTAFLPEANFLFVESSLTALQQLAAYHRRHFESAGKPMPVIGITGSNGKTIVKEWLFQLLQHDYNIVRSPRSYNSQIGVPVSVWQMNEAHSLALFEAGISQTGEMEKLEAVIQPAIGILTNIGEAHSEGFRNAAEKFSEKIKLFRRCQTVIGREEDFAFYGKNYRQQHPGQQLITWGRDASNLLVVQAVEKRNGNTHIRLSYQGAGFTISIPFTDDASIENAITCCCLLRHMGYDPAVIASRMQQLQPVNMRLELKKGIHQCSIINDSYSNDLSSLAIALGFLEHQSAGLKRTVILSDFPESGMEEKNLYTKVAAHLLQHRVNRLIGIGEKIHLLKNLLDPFAPEQEYYSTTDDFLNNFLFSKLKEECILVKGARVFRFEKIVQALEQKVHQTVLEINLNAMAHNLKTFQSLLQPSTKIMAMVKAFAYGSGAAEIAQTLQFHHADYLGVAYADEGVELRRAGIRLPIMVMSPEEESFAAMVEYDLQPAIYSFELLKAVDRFLKQEGLQQYPVHLEVETGMNRLGFALDDMEKLAEFLSNTSSMKVQSVFTHLAAAEDPEQDMFTMQQAALFSEACKVLEKKPGYGFIKHIANTAALIRFPQLQMDMVRLGIGLYGIDSTGTEKLNLQTVATLKSAISQIKKIKAGDSVSYGRKEIVSKETLSATVRIGYADGFPRRLGNGKGFMLVKGRAAPVIGTVCMDMTMIDITGIDSVEEGDEVIIFGKELPLQHLAGRAGTIPYEIMTGISQRVRRVYFEE
jgi:alanine racemase